MKIDQWAFWQNNTTKTFVIENLNTSWVNNAKNPSFYNYYGRPIYIFQGEYKLFTSVGPNPSQNALSTLPEYYTNTNNTFIYSLPTKENPKNLTLLGMIDSTSYNSSTLTISGSLTAGDQTYNTTSIGQNAFLTYVQNPSSNILGYWKTVLNNNIKNIVVSEGITNIGDYAFGYLPNTISSISLPDGLKTIGAGAFFRLNQNYSNSVTINQLPSSLASIGGGAFWGVNIANNNKIVMPNKDTTWKKVIITDPNDNNSYNNTNDYNTGYIPIYSLVPPQDASSNYLGEWSINQFTSFNYNTIVIQNNSKWEYVSSPSIPSFEFTSTPINSSSSAIENIQVEENK